MPADRPPGAVPRRSSPLPGLLHIRPDVSRLPTATRVAVSTAIPLLIGWAAGDVGAGLIATLGAFTADYGSQRPYRSRGLQLAVIAAALAAAVTVGAWAAAQIWVAVVAVSAVAVLAVWLCSALSVGPPGAYLFVLVAAAGVGVSASQRPPWQIGLLVLAGGAVAWFSQLSAAPFDPRAPEKAAVAAAGDAVAEYLEGLRGGPGAASSAVARRRAALALTRAWSVLVDYQPRTPARGTLQQLREANHALHVLFAAAMNAVGEGREVDAGAAVAARRIGGLDLEPAAVTDRDPNRPPLRRASAPTLLAGAIRPGTLTRRVMLRVAVAAPIAGAVAGTLGIGHVYWAMAAAVLVLHQGTHRAATLRRGADRVLGTLVGLGLAAAVLSLHPQGLWLVLVVTALQFALEMFIVRNYAVASMFITALALIIASGGGGGVAVPALLLDRGVDTLIGCGVGLIVYLAAARGQEAHRISAAVTAVIGQTILATRFLAAGDVLTLPSRAARRDLQERLFDLADAEDAARNGSRRDRAAADRRAPLVEAVEHLGYATITACWAAEQRSVFGSADPQAYLAVLHTIDDAVRTSVPPAIDAELPPFAAAEIRLLALALAERR